MKIRTALAGVALAAATAPLAQPASAMTCAPGFEALCFVIGTACVTVNQVPVPDKIHFSCELGR